jgi:phosphoglycerate dehydrogenase-like enzyme
VKVIVLDDYQGRARDFADWASLGPQVDVTFIREHLRGRQLTQALSEAEVVVAMRERTVFSSSIFRELRGMRLLVTTGRRNAAIDLEAAKEFGITVCGTTSPGVESGVSTTTELTWGLILGLAYHLLEEHQALRGGGWQVAIPCNISGSVLGLAGLGRLGSAMVPIAKAFQMPVIAWSANLDAAHAASLGVTAVSKEILLQDSDILSIHLRLSDRTRSLFGAAELALMKSSAYLINTSRGEIIDEDALIDSLAGKRIAGAGLDVFNEEPLPVSHRLISLPNVVLTPHLGYVSERNYGVYFPEVVEDIAAYLSGAPLRVISRG